jgi:hypothetical protein
MQALCSTFIAAVEDETVGGDQRSRSKVIIAAPEGWAGSGARCAQDALGRIVEAGALLGTLQPFLSICGQW